MTIGTAARSPGAAVDPRGDPAPAEVRGRLVLRDAVVPGRIEIAGDRIASISEEESAAGGPYVCPGFVDIHVHGWGGHDAADGPGALEGMARALLRHGVTSFLPTAETSPLEALVGFAQAARTMAADPSPDRADILGFNLEGPFISRARAGAQNPAFIVPPSAVARDRLVPLLDGARVWTVAPEVEGALDLIAWLASRGVAVSLGHSDATAADAEAGYRAGARGTTHLFNAMSGLDHHAPGLAAVALARGDISVELIADGLHVDRGLWPIVARSTAPDRLVLVSDAIAPAGTGDGRWTIAGLEVDVRDGECRLVSDGRLAGSVIALDAAVRALVGAGVPLPVGARAASANPLELVGVHDRGRLAAGQLADLVELDDSLGVRRVMKRGRWLEM